MCVASVLPCNGMATCAECTSQPMTTGDRHQPPQLSMDKQLNPINRWMEYLPLSEIKSNIYPLQI